MARYHSVRSYIFHVGLLSAMTTLLGAWSVSTTKKITIPACGKKATTACLQLAHQPTFNEAELQVARNVGNQLGTIAAPKALTITPPQPGRIALYTVSPSAGSNAGKQIELLFVATPTGEQHAVALYGRVIGKHKFWKELPLALVNEQQQQTQLILTMQPNLHIKVNDLTVDLNPPLDKNE